MRDKTDMPPEANNPSPRANTQRPATPGQVAPARTRAASLRRTVIPILLTLAVLLPALAVWFAASDVDSPFRQLPSWAAAALYAGGAASAVLAAINMAAARGSGRR